VRKQGKTESKSLVILSKAKDLCILPAADKMQRSFAAKCAAQDDKCSLLHLRPLTRIHDLRGIDRVLVHLLFHDLSIFPDQEVHAARRLIFVFVDSVLSGGFAAPIAQQREGNSNLVGESFIGECTIHAHTQDLGVGCFQRFQVLLEVFHLLRSTTGERKDIKREYDLLLPSILAE
jgi:hypothetical protein